MLHVHVSYPFSSVLSPLLPLYPYITCTCSISFFLCPFSSPTPLSLCYMYMYHIPFPLSFLLSYPSIPMLHVHVSYPFSFVLSPLLPLYPYVTCTCIISLFLCPFSSPTPLYPYITCTCIIFVFLYPSFPFSPTPHITHMLSHSILGMLSAAASIGLVLLWDVEGGLTEIDKFLYSTEDYIKVRIRENHTHFPRQQHMQ